MKRNLLLFALFVLVCSSNMSAQAYYLRGEAAPCDWGGNFTPTCQLTDPDNNGIYELTYNFGATPIGRKMFKIYNQTTDSWYPSGDNAWYIHNGGSVTFRINNATKVVEAVNSGSFSICAPGAFSGWNNATPMTNVGGNTWCYTIPNPGNYEWKPTVCGSWDSWQPSNGERNVSSQNWFVATTTPNEQVCVTYDPATGRVSPPAVPIGIFVRGTAPLCGWGNYSPTCKMADPDGDGVFTLTLNLGSTPLGLQEFKVHNSASGNWYPGGANAWYAHKGGSVTFKYFSATGEVQVIDGFDGNICAPGEFSNWNNNFSMKSFHNGMFCTKIATPGTYEWKPTLCGTFNSWQPGSGDRSVNSDNWKVTTTIPNQQVCVVYDAATGEVKAGGTNVPTMSQWGLILFALLMMGIGMLTVRQRSLAIAGTSNANFSLRGLPFHASDYTKALIFSTLAMIAIFATAVYSFGYQLTTADVPGSILALPLVAYLVMLFIEEEQ
jgi:hypothetical protein